MPRNCLSVFCKYPREGRVKTRLGKEIGYEIAATLARTFLKDILAKINDTDMYSNIYFYPSDTKEKFQKLTGKLPLLPQQGENLGEKMLNCLGDELQNHDKAIIIGTDSPDLPAAYLRKAFAKLDDHDCVLGPAEDGGFYLIGFRKGSNISSLLENFSQIEWGSHTVLDEAIRILRAKGMSVFLLPKWYDIDEIPDLVRFFRENRDKENCPDSCNYLNNLLKSGKLDIEMMKCEEPSSEGR